MMPPRHTYQKLESRRFSSKPEWERYRAWLKRNTCIALGLLPAPAKTPLRARVFDRRAGDGFTCEKVAFESLPGFHVTGNLYRPVGRRRMPGILSPHGHWADGRLQDHDPRGSVPARCVQLARMGAAVFTYDMVGYNDSCQVPHYSFSDDPHWGLSLLAVQAWDSIRALDFLLTIPGVDSRRLGMTGASGGGTQTFTLMAVDGRLAAAAPVTMISYLQQGGCRCENAPLLHIDSTNVDMARLFAPKPAFIGSATGDWTRNVPREEFPAIRDIYRLYGAARRVSHHQVRDRHNYNRELREHVYGFFNRYLFGARSAAPVPESDAGPPPLRDRMVWWGIRKPDPIPAEELKKMWRNRAANAVRAHLGTAAAARRELVPLLPHLVGILADRPSRPRVTGGIEWRVSAGTLVVRPVKTAPYAGEFLSTFNRVAAADRILEIVNGVERVSGRVRLAGRGSAGIWCLFAAALSPKVSAVEADVPRGFDPDSSASWTRHADLPSVLQIGGLATVLAGVGRRTIRLNGAGAKVRGLVRRYAR